MMTTHRRADRPLEWFLAGFSAVWGGSALFTSGLFSLAPYLQMLDRLTTVQWAAISMALGAVHMIALLVNGTAWWTPILRLVTTSANAGFFAWIAAILFYSPDVGPAAMTYGYFALGFAWCAVAAGQDVAKMKLGTYGL
ncbi:MAG: hypothetical protein EA355_06095 [Rhodobacteraceae bacterium]|nr:MAG: hypothetical protein EA355_06095 [Paracoccaceae bacterium]